MLFRPGFIAQRESLKHGKILLVRPISFVALTAFFFVLVTSVVAFFFLFSYHRKVHVLGIVIPEAGLLRVASSQSGVITQSHVREGQLVRAGDALFAVASIRSTLAGGSADLAVSSLIRSRRESLLLERTQQHQQNVQRIDVAKRKAADLSNDIQRVAAQIELQQRRVGLAERAMSRTSDLRRENFVSEAQVQDKEAELLDQKQRLADLERVKDAGRRELSQTQAEARDLLVQAQRDLEASGRDVASLDQDLTESEAKRESTIVAAESGIIGAINVEPGQAVVVGQIVASLVPRGALLQAELYVPSRAAGFIKAGMDVLLRYQAFPYQKFGQHHGHVREVSISPMKAGDMGLGFQSSAGEEPLYRVRVSLDEQAIDAFGVSQPLRTGMTIDASVMLEKRRLFEWALEPLLTVTGHF